MKTNQILDKYRTIVGKLLDINPAEIFFYIDGKEVRECTDLEKEKNYDLYTNYVQSWEVGKYTVRHIAEEVDTLISSWELYRLPHCCAILVSCKALVKPSFRSKRVGTILNNLRQELGRAMGYSAIICTDIESNINQRKLLATNGWEDIFNVVNKRTTNKVFISALKL